MKTNIWLLCFLLAGCVGDRLEFRNKGDAVVDNDSICIISKPGDVLTYYLLTSSTDNYQKPVAVSTNIQKRHPATCIKYDVKFPAKYSLIYILNNKKYRFEFITETPEKIIKQD